MRLRVVLLLVASTVPAAAHGQCPVEALTAAVPALGRLGVDVAASGPRLVVGSERGKAAFLYQEVAGAWQADTTLRSPDPSQAQRFGSRVAISGDTVLVADPRHPAGGVVYAFVHDGSAWRFQAELRPDDNSPGDLFGNVLAFDGDTAAAYSISDTGAVYVFERSGTTWEQTARRTRDFLLFGLALAVDGDTLLVGAPGDPEHGFNAGACFVFSRQSGNWGQTAKFYDPAPGAEAMFGSAVAVRGDLAVVSSPAPFDPARQGTAAVFERNGNAWASAVVLVPYGASAVGALGVDVAFEGARILLADLGDPATPRPGAVHVFEPVSGEWRQSAKLRSPSAGDDHRFGLSVALRGDDAFVGSPAEGAGNETGVVHVFDMSLGVPASYCQSTVNSTGQPATIDSVGSHLVAVDDFTLLARPVPDGTGFFLASGQTTQVPRWDGFLCVASPLARTPVLDARGGELFGRVELAALPFTVLPGSTWHFQAWFEDPAAGGTGANLSNGVSVTFCP